ncbi:hypothetical protein NHQ30_011256 [Ciborinia camelliae]|nr:hypothetical protein NHQ30_011256 [Ciborinia camelliae]
MAPRATSRQRRNGVGFPHPGSAAEECVYIKAGKWSRYRYSKGKRSATTSPISSFEESQIRHDRRHSEVLVFQSSQVLLGNKSSPAQSVTYSMESDLRQYPELADGHVSRGVASKILGTISFFDPSGLKRSRSDTDRMSDSPVRAYEQSFDIHHAQGRISRQYSADFTANMESHNEPLSLSSRNQSRSSATSTSMGLVQSCSSDTTQNMDGMQLAEATLSRNHSIESSLIPIQIAPPFKVSQDTDVNVNNESFPSQFPQPVISTSFHDGKTATLQPFLFSEVHLNTKQDHGQGSFQADEWDRIQRMRLDVWSLRSKIHEARSTLRAKQEIRSQADDRYIMRLNEHEVNVSVGEPEVSLSDLRFNCRMARDECGPMEDECMSLEDQLTNEEFRLTRLERQFYEKLNHPSVLQDPASFSNPKDQLCVPNASFNVEETANPCHPLVANYLSKLGDLDLLKEDIQDAMEEKIELENQKEARKAYNLTLEPEDQSWLDDFENMMTALYKDLHQTKTEVAELRAGCDAEGLLDSDGEPKDLQNLEEAQFEHEEGLNANGNKSEYVKFPLLIPFPGAIAEGHEIHDQSSDLYHRSDASNGRVNEWMLRILRSSPLDVQLLAACHRMLREVKDGDRNWQLGVLSRWYMDETNQHKGPPELQFYDSSVAAETGIESEKSTISNGSFSDENSLDGTDRTNITFSLDGHPNLLQRWC